MAGELKYVFATINARQADNWRLLRTPAAASLLTSHPDQVTQLAPNTTLLATSPFCANAITQIGANMLTVQGHPELTRALAREVYEFRREDQGQELTNQALVSVNNPISDTIFSEWVFNFIDHVCSRHSS